MDEVVKGLLVVVVEGMPEVEENVVPKVKAGATEQRVWWAVWRRAFRRERRLSYPMLY